MLISICTRSNGKPESTLVHLLALWDQWRAPGLVQPTTPSSPPTPHSPRLCILFLGWWRKGANFLYFLSILLQRVLKTKRGQTGNTKLPPSPPSSPPNTYTCTHMHTHTQSGECLHFWSLAPLPCNVYTNINQHRNKHLLPECVSLLNSFLSAHIKNEAQWY